MKSLADKVQDIITSSKNDYLELADQSVVARFNQRETVNITNHYINDRYVERDDNAIFWNLSTSRITHFAKLLGLDTKDFMPYGEGEYTFLQAWALRKKLRQWFNEGEFYQTLNDVSEGVATYGSVVWKRFKEKGETKLEEVDLTNIYFDQGVKYIKDADGVVELHYLSQAELWAKDEVWDNIQDVLKKEKDASRIEIWEYWGWFKSETDIKPKYIHEIGYSTGKDHIQLFTEEVDKKDFPYYDFHLGKYRKRWLRVGVVERLFKLQQRINQLVNQNAQATEIASLLLFRTQSGDVMGNVLEQALNGQIINSADLEQIGITNSGLNQFIQELQLIERQADRLCLTPDIIQGEASPSNTTFRGIAVVSSAAISAFSAYKQNIGEKIANILLTDILPAICGKLNRGTIIELAEDDEDIEMYDTQVVKTMKKDYLLSGNGAVTPEVEQAIQTNVENNIKTIGRKVEVEKGTFNFKYKIKMMPTNETVDKAAKNDAYFNALQMIGANPALINIPLFKQYLEDNGISWWKLTPKQAEQIMAGATGGQMPEQKKPDALLAQATAQ